MYNQYQDNFQDNNEPSFQNNQYNQQYEEQTKNYQTSAIRQEDIQVQQEIDYGMDDVDENVIEYDIQKQQQKDMNFRQPLGFERKMNQLGQLKASHVKNSSDLKQFETLDEKIHLITQNKGLATYVTKKDANFNLQDGHCVQMIKWENEQLVFTEEAKQKNRISFVMVYGEKGSGKSTLLNLLINSHQNYQGNKFGQQFGDESQTSGIIMWSEPLYNSQNNSNIFFLEYQNYNYDKKSLRDYQFFYLCLIISSLFIVNIKGPLGQNFCNTISDFYQLKEIVNLNDIEEKEEFSILMPQLLVVCRDFQHEIKQKGLVISGHSYLEHFLFDDMTMINSNAQDKKILHRLLKYLRNRDAMGMVNPVKNNNQNDLQFSTVDQLDPFFQEELRILKLKILQKTNPKQCHGVFLSKNMIVNYINSIIEDCNTQQDKITISKAFSITVENEFILVYNECIDAYNKFLNQNFTDDAFKSFHDLNEILLKAREETYNRINTLKAYDVEFAENLFSEYYQKLKDFIERQEKKIKDLNNQELIDTIKKTVQQKMKDVKKQTENASFSAEDLTTISDEYSKLMKQVLIRCIGSELKSDAIIQIILHVQQQMVGLFYGEIQEMFEKQGTKKNEIDQKIKAQQNKVSQTNEQISKQEQKKLDKQKLQESNEQQIEQLEKQNKEKEKELQDLQKEVEAIKTERDNFVKKKAKCC